MLRRPPGQSGRAGTTRIFLSGQAVSLLGDGLAVLTVPLLVLGLTRNPLAVAASAAPASVGYLLVGLPAGVIVDRLSPWRVLIAADLVRATAFGVLYVLAVAGGLHVWLVLALVFLAGTARAFFDTALAVAVQDMFEVPALVRANASLELATQLSSVLGPGMVGVLAGFGGITIALLLNAGTFVISLVSLVIVSGDRHRSLPRSPAALPWRVLGQEFGQGVRYLLKNKLILTLTALQMVINLCLAADKLVVFYAKDTLQLTATLVSLVLVGGGGGWRPRRHERGQAGRQDRPHPAGRHRRRRDRGVIGRDERGKLGGDADSDPGDLRVGARGSQPGHPEPAPGDRPARPAWQGQRHGADALPDRGAARRPDHREPDQPAGQRSQAGLPRLRPCHRDVRRGGLAQHPPPLELAGDRRPHGPVGEELMPQATAARQDPTDPAWHRQGRDQSSA
jgi:hypothetical protein